MYSTSKLFLILCGVFFAAVMFSLVLNGVLMRFFRTFGLREEGAGVRWAASAKPAFGGIGFYLVFLGAFSVYGALFPKTSDPFQPRLLALLAATGAGFLMGLADDAYNTRPLLKFVTQVACGVMLIAGGCSIRLFGDPVLDHALTILWVVGMMNSINMLDNMDAITSVVSVCILLAALLALLRTGNATDVDVVLTIAVAGSLCGFLFHNWNPSRMYMGDTGSQFLGVFLAYVGIRCFWNGPSLGGIYEPWRAIVSVLVVFALPIIDTTTVTINRLLKGRSPFVGGRDHTTHHLGYAGFSDAQVALAFAGLGGLSVFLAQVMLLFVPVWEAVHSLVFLGYVVLLFAVLFGLTKRPRIDRSLRSDA